MCVYAAGVDSSSVIKLHFMCLGFFPLYLVLSIMDFVHPYMWKWKKLTGKDAAKILVLQHGLSASNLRELKS